MKKLLLLFTVLCLVASCGQKKDKYDPYKLSGTVKQAKQDGSFDIDFKKVQDHKTIHVKFNDKVGYDALFDTGCDEVSISYQEFIDLVKQGTISREDVRGSADVEYANGGQEELPVVRIHSLSVIDKTGKEHIVSDLNATVVLNLDAKIIVGTKFIDNLAKHSYTVDLDKNIIHFQ